MVGTLAYSRMKEASCFGKERGSDLTPGQTCPNSHKLRQSGVLSRWTKSRSEPFSMVTQDCKDRAAESICMISCLLRNAFAPGLQATGSKRGSSKRLTFVFHKSKGQRVQLIANQPRGSIAPCDGRDVHNARTIYLSHDAHPGQQSRPRPLVRRTARREIWRDDCGRQTAGLILISPLEMIFSFMLVLNYTGSVCSLGSRW